MSSLSPDECEFLSDSKYRVYTSQVEKALKSFENTSEWADLISALGKLNKVLLAHVKYPVVPRKVIIGKRLAQCLHPALPSGVHLKALETYEIIFKSIGSKHLGQDLFIYSAGLFPLLAYAAMNVKPSLLGLYENYFVPLGKSIKPGLTGLLLGLLPGLEEGSEYYERTNNLLELFCKAAEETFFYGCLWECVLICPSIRLAAVTFVTSHYNRKQTMEDQLHFIGTNIDTMVKAICETVQDSSVLVQRCLLDFLLLGFPMHNSQLTKEDMTHIVIAVVNVVLRRDMSLNRRLFAWLLGIPASSGSAAQKNQAESEKYFNTYSRELLLHAVRVSFAQKNDLENKVPPRILTSLRPFRILISLLDKPEIGSVIVEDLLIDVFRCLYRECASVFRLKTDDSAQKLNKLCGNRSNKRNRDAIARQEKNATEIIKTANLLFGTFEPYYLWDNIARKFEQVCEEACDRHFKTNTQGLTILELCELVDFLLEKVSLETYTETQTEYLPDLLRRIANTLQENCAFLTYQEITRSLEFCSKILTKVQPSMAVMADELDDVTEKASLEYTEKDPRNGDISNNERDSSKSPEMTESETFLSAESDIDSPAKVIPRVQQQRSHLISTSSNGVNPTTLIQACVQCFQKFYYTFVTERIFTDKHIVKNAMSNFLRDSIDVCNEKKPPEIKIEPLDSCMVKVTNECKEAYSRACQLLVDFSTFPIYCTDHNRVLDHTMKGGDEVTFPDWLQALISCCCFVENFDIQTASVSSILDLISLTQSVIGAGQDYAKNRGSSEGTVSVLILPSLAPSILIHINRHTPFYWVVASKLWGYLDDCTPDFHQRAVELIYQLHQLSPSIWTCEDVIGHDLVSDDMSLRIKAYKKFALLWHLTRSQKPKSMLGMPPRTFDRSMFVILDSLQSDISTTKSLTHSWMTHAIQRGDIARILEPILLMLLNPDTARISIQHVNVLDQRKVCLKDDNNENTVDSNDLSEARIFAISNEGGNVIYHVSAKGQTITKKKAEELQTLTLTTAVDGATKICSSRAANDDLLFERVNPDDLNLRVNPFGSETSLDRIIFDGYTPPKSDFPNLRNIKRLDKDTCQKEGISFDDEDADEQTEIDEIAEPAEPEDENVEAIAKSIVDDLVRRVFDEIEANEAIELQTCSTEVSKQRTFSTGSNNSVDDFLDTIDHKASMSTIDSPDVSDGETSPDSKRKDGPDLTGVHPLHTHILLYFRKYDCQRTLYALSTLRAILQANPRLVICSMSTTGVNSVRTPHFQQVQLLLARHRRSILGKNFFSELDSDALSGYRSTMYVEILISICLYFIRGYYPNLMMSKLSEEVRSNKEVQILSTEILTMLLSELISLCKDSGKGFATFLSDMLARCKVQKAMLHCLLASVYNARLKGSNNSMNNIGLTEAIITFNEEGMDCNTNQTLQIRLIKLILVIIILEDCIRVQKGEGDTLPVTNPDWERPKVNFQLEASTFRYMQSLPVAYQGMFISAALSALKQQHMSNMHCHWMNMITLAMPYMGRSLGSIVISVVNQLCRNIELLAVQYECGYLKTESNSQPKHVPPDHIITMLEGLTTLCHYSLLDNVAQVSIGQAVPLHSTVAIQDSTASTGQIISNLIHVFTPQGAGRIADFVKNVTKEIYETSPAKDGTSPLPPVISSRRGLLSILPRIIASLSAVWKATYWSETKISDNHEPPAWMMGYPKAVRQHILEFLSPISVHHSVNLLAAMAVVWNDRRKSNSPPTLKKVIPGFCDEQLLLVDLVSSIKVLPTDTLIQTVKQVIKQPPPTNQDKNKKRTPLEVSMLQFFYAYVQRTTATQLMDSWPSLLSLLKDGLQSNLVPPGIFLLQVIFNEFIHKTPSFEEKKDHKDVQEITQKLLEACSVIAGSSLEQVTWFRRNLAVNVDLQTDLHELHEDEVDDKPPPKPTADKLMKISAHHSVQALALLAELIAPLLDVVYGSDEKDRVVPFLTTSIMYNVFPYLKHHSANNMRSFLAASQILASLSDYQYTRKAWKKDAFDLVMDTGFFQMDVACVRFWRSIIDNLMTHDKTTFKDLMTRVNTAQSGTLHLFSSREAEFEQRAQLLKKLSFTIFCSEMDQYQRHMPDIQERLADALKLSQIPIIQAQVFLCFRVLMLRISPQHLTYLWTIIVTELVHVFLQIEQELSPEGDECKMQLQKIAAVDASWAYSNGLNAHNNPAWLQLYLSACKLLDLALVMPADSLPQFQVYRWAFLGDSTIEDPVKNKKKDERPFIPHVIRIAKLMKARNQKIDPRMEHLPNYPMITMTEIKSIDELFPFFNTLYHSYHSDSTSIPATTVNQTTCAKTIVKSKSAPDVTNVTSQNQSANNTKGKSWKEYVETLIEYDFIDPVPKG
ncbi:protein DOP1A-like [Tubulanus polymorphus]|uniref:protein DOP1A-like n=1 Tax=Tubulanus polymorphus TaxID=672921 RepID=UPI003DA3B1EE